MFFSGALFQGEAHRFADADSQLNTPPALSRPRVDLRLCIHGQGRERQALHLRLARLRE
jgi:hypothetical protein